LLKPTHPSKTNSYPFSVPYRNCIKSKNMKKVAVIIKHPYRDNDYRVDVYEVEESVTGEDLKNYVMSQMLGPFEVVSITDRISLDCKIKK